MITLYLAEDQELLNTAMQQLLNLEDDMKVVGSATDGRQAWQEIQAVKPDIAILDIEMPYQSGLTVAAKMKNEALPTRAIILTTFAQRTYFNQAVKADVAAYLLKDSPTDELVAVIRRVQTGEVIYAPELVRNMVTEENNPLTDREMDILKWVAQGASNKKIAAELYLSDGTVRNYLSAIFSKLGIHSRTEAINLAQQNKWLV
ncbi:response regulator transcription factor [Levilactobacillus bambusae]|uniref:DNA-binding response regulator n=1 Tax=Levilactobacillus bambusae TaxID=2024736 RepID=A0A2V1N179_9LACO|nr:response regulator transcription factor [Levilactobacillus bambusae]PWG00498.1 DNA-binding response regulator [Levilactobacillus bambusae]